MLLLFYPSSREISSALEKLRARAIDNGQRLPDLSHVKHAHDDHQELSLFLNKLDFYLLTVNPQDAHGPSLPELLGFMLLSGLTTCC